MEKNEKKKVGLFKTIIRQFKEFKTFKRSVVYFYMVTGILSTALINLSAIYMTKLIIDGFTTYAPGELYYFIGTMMATLIALMFMKRFSDTKTQIIFIEVRIKQFLVFNQKFMDVDYPLMEDSDFQNQSSTSLRALGGDNEGFQQTYTLTYQILGILTTVITTAIMLAFFNYLLIIACLITWVGTTFAQYLIAKNMYKNRNVLSEKQRQERYYYDTTYDFTFGKDIRIYQLQNHLEKSHKKASTSYVDVVKKLARFDFFAGLIELIPLLLQDILAYAIVIYAYYQGQLSIADLSMYLVAVASLSTYLRTLGKNVSDLRAGIRYVEDFYGFLDDKTLFNKTGNLAPLLDTFEIEFKNVSFKYPKTDNYIFKDLSFKIAKGEKLAIVGSNGAGKTTLVKLICGLFYPTEGVILIDGIDTTMFDKTRYQEMFSVVFQDVHVYAASVVENILGSAKDASNVLRAKNALAAVGLKEKIENLPSGYNHQILKIIDENGVDFSGGERQKIAIARALYKNGNVVILDEPTAALDALAEAKIYEEFNALAGDKTSIYVSHRLSSTKFCDHIALFDGSTLKEYGTHDSLMEQKGIYYQMFVTQGKYYKEGITSDA